MEPDRARKPGQALIEAGIVPEHPGAYLAGHILPHRGKTAEEAAAEMHIPVRVLQDVIGQRRPVDPEIAAKLSTWTGLSAGFWLNMQAASELQVPDPA